MALKCIVLDVPITSGRVWVKRISVRTEIYFLILNLPGGVGALPGSVFGSVMSLFYHDLVFFYTKSNASGLHDAQYPGNIALPTHHPGKGFFFNGP